MLRRLILDVLFPVRGESIVELSMHLSRVEGVEAVNITVKEVDVDTQNILVVVEGENISFEELKEVLEKHGGVIHSVDQVSAGSRVIEPPHYLIE
ncbi:DUF211 domain-containing protein [Thermosphaera aggregans]|uniref:DUF211 domain-containing protein n=1 Tax=Thermosphaera aggregans (strain DSM 11486 / M11TL) TaxID=633148 RepID=D5U0Y4_THEAM|nr:protein of unknown function DUF211 [Thermosphaera aggregans DSM 11486]